MFLDFLALLWPRVVSDSRAMPSFGSENWKACVFPHGAAQPSRAGGDQARAWGAGRWCKRNEAERDGKRRRPMGPEARDGRERWLLRFKTTEI